MLIIESGEEGRGCRKSACERAFIIGLFIPYVPETQAE